MSQENGNDVQSRLAAVRLIAMDVDGVLTDGSIDLSAGEGETKRFHVADGLGLQLAMNAGLVVAWITGRNSPVVERRAAELGVTHLLQGCANKAKALAELMASYTITQANIAYMGDDLNDIPAYSVAGVKFCPVNGVAEMKSIADFVTEHAGGAGAVREMCDVILKAQGRWNGAVETYLGDILKDRGEKIEETGAGA